MIVRTGFDTLVEMAVPPTTAAGVAELPAMTGAEQDSLGAKLREDGSRNTRAGGLDAMALSDALVRARLGTDLLHHGRENRTADLTRPGALLLPAPTGPHVLA